MCDCGGCYPSLYCRAPVMDVGRIRYALKAGWMYNTWDCYRRNGIQDLPPDVVRVGIPIRYCPYIACGSVPFQPC